MDVTGPGSVQGAIPVQRTRTAGEAEPAAEVGKVAAPRPVRDEVEISSVGRMMEELSQSSAVRAERLAQIRSEIQAGTYETPEKLEAALDKMLRDLGIRDERSEGRSMKE